MDGMVGSECLITTRELARCLCVVPRTVHRWRKRRGFPSFRITTGAIRYDRTEVHCWLDRPRAEAAQRSDRMWPEGEREVQEMKIVGAVKSLVEVDEFVGREGMVVHEAETLDGARE